MEKKITQLEEEINKSVRFKTLTKVINYSISSKHGVPLPQLRDKDYWRNYWDEEENFWKNWVRSGKSKKQQQERINYVDLCLRKNTEENLIANAEDYYDILGLSINEISDKVPFPGESISIGKIRKAYQKLNLQYHPDKGKVLSEDLRSKILEKIREAGECLGNKYTKQKYDLYLCVKSEEYIESGSTEKKLRWFKPNGWSQQKFLRLKRLVDEELIGKFISFFQEYLDYLDLDWKTWNYYQKILGEPTKPNINNLYQETLGKPIIDLFNAVNESLGNSGAIIRKNLRLVRENSGIDELLEEKPTLTKEELDNFPNEEFFNQEWNKVVDAFFESQVKKDKLELSIDKLKLNCKELTKRIEEKRAKKKFLIEELEKWLQEGREIFELEEIDKKQITEFLNNFDNYLSRNKDYEATTINKGIQEEKQENIDNLIFELKNLESQGEAENWESGAEKAISEEEKQFIINYLNEKLYETIELVNSEVERIPHNLKKVKNWLRGEGLEWDYELEIKKHRELKEVENIRAKVIEYLYTHRLNSLSLSGSFEELKAKRREVSSNLLLDFGKKISAEIEVELGIKFNELLEEEQELITNINEEKKEKYPSIITKNKWIVVNKWRNVAVDRVIDKVNDYWKINQASDRINGKSKIEILGENWEDDLLVKLAPFNELNQAKINAEFNPLISLISNEVKKVIDAQIATIASVNDEWNKQTSTNLINKKNQTEILGDNWKNYLQNLKTVNYITKEKDRLIELINKERKAELDGSATKIQSVFRGKKARLLFKKLKKIQQETWQNNAIDAVNSHWNFNETNCRINDKNKSEILSSNWQIVIKSKNTENEINAERDRLISLINKFKSIETIWKKSRVAIEKIENYWKSQSDNGELDEKINRQSIAEVLGKKKWHEDFFYDTITEEIINDQEVAFTKKISDAKNGTEEEQRVYKELKRKIESEEDHINYSLEIEKLRLEKWKTELSELLERKFSEWEHIHSEEEKLNKELERLRSPGLLSSILKSLENNSFTSKLLQIFYKNKNPIDKWFDELEEFIGNSDHKFLKEVCGEISEGEEKEIFSRIFSQLKEERKKIKSERNFKNNSYFKIGEIRECFQKISKNVKKNLDDEFDEWKSKIKDDVGSLVKEIEGLASVLDHSQKKLEIILENFTDKIINSPKGDKSLLDEELVFNSITTLLGKFKEVKKAEEIAKKIACSYLEGKNLPEEENKKWLSKLKEKNLTNSREVVRYLQEVRSSLNNNNNNKPLPIIPIVGVISGIFLLGFIAYKVKKNKIKK